MLRRLETIFRQTSLCSFLASTSFSSSKNALLGNLRGGFLNLASITSGFSSSTELSSLVSALLLAVLARLPLFPAPDRSLLLSDYVPSTTARLLLDLRERALDFLKVPDLADLGDGD